MMLLTAAQHVSGFLTSGQSARRQAGFQTICLSKDLIAAAGPLKPTTKEWFATARNYALYSNQGGIYDDILQYLKLQ